MLFLLEGLLEQTHEGRFLCAACGVCRRRGAAAAARGSRACGLPNRRERICGDGAALPFAVAKSNGVSADACDRCKNDRRILGIAPPGYAAANWHAIREFRSTFAGRGYPCRVAVRDFISLSLVLCRPPAWIFPPVGRKMKTLPPGLRSRGLRSAIRSCARMTQRITSITCSREKRASWGACSP